MFSVCQDLRTILGDLGGCPGGRGAKHGVYSVAVVGSDCYYEHVDNHNGFQIIVSH